MKEELHVSAKSTRMKHVKRLGTLLGVCAPFVSKAWCQKEIATIIEEDEKNLETKIETVYQHEHLCRVMVVCATMDKE